MEDEARNRGTHSTDDLSLEESVLDQVRKALSEIQFGSIVIKIHQGKVVGLETSTKLRLDS